MINLITPQDILDSPMTLDSAVAHYNKIIASKMQVGYTQPVAPDRWAVISPKKFPADTHKFYYLTELIEEEAPEPETINYKSMYLELKAKIGDLK